jgi:hypothetical protein
VAMSKRVGEGKIPSRHEEGLQAAMDQWCQFQSFLTDVHAQPFFVWRRYDCGGSSIDCLARCFMTPLVNRFNQSFALGF